MSLAVNPRCTQLIGDFRDALWPSPNQFHDQHALAWLRYFVQREFPIRLDVSGRVSGTIGFAG